MADRANGAVTVDAVTVEYGRRLFEAMADVSAAIEEHREDVPESVTRALDRLVNIAQHQPR